ncbi:hypothetical protein M5D96_012001 [Drosophila gunungcola]|uniref:Uncharacterized protein n=1 Tax=Drosophila gunungcola TaxID=103775 RepID=A0A9P9YEF5_9MUSC|nr:hypothetical protein M5D96_012001 [Drosophila gunungcola]
MYACRVKSCKARLHLTEDESRVFSCEDHLRHSHGAQDLEMKKINAIEEIKNRCKLTDKKTDLKQIFNDVMAEIMDGNEMVKPTLRLNELFHKQRHFQLGTNR